MRNLILTNIDVIISIITLFVTWFLGFIVKKNNLFKSNLIPLQNFLIMIISCGVYWWATGDFSLVIASSSPVATLFYDFWHQIKKEV